MKLVCLALCLGLTAVYAACPNGCSGHGQCDSNDQCTCYNEGKVLNEDGNDDGETLFSQWTGADCSMMTCPRGTSWSVIVGSAGSNAHDRSIECSDAGICDRVTGMCTCYKGYDGSACQRTTCPNDCSGHGVCQSNKDFAEDYARAMATSINLKHYTPRCTAGSDYAGCTRNIEHNDDYYKTYMVSYDKAWDAGLHFGCLCDSGYSGADCSLRECPTSFDPLDSSCEVDMADGTTSTTISLRKTDVDSDGSQTWAKLELTGDTNTATLIGSTGADYLSNFERDNIFYEPKEFHSTSAHFSDMARRCTAFYVSDDVDVTTAVDSTSWVIFPGNMDSWVCSYMWDSTMIKTPYCAGRWTSLECSGRGICDRTQGTCTCFSGYTGNDCAVVDELA